MTSQDYDPSLAVPSKGREQTAPQTSSVPSPERRRLGGLAKFAALLGAATLGACAHQVGHYDFYTDDANLILGEAVNQNIAAQTVNPDGAAGDVEASGARVGLAQQRYRADNVEKPRPVGTLESTQGSQQPGGEGGGRQ
jgi:hypothetical protein